MWKGGLEKLKKKKTTKWKKTIPLHTKLYTQKKGKSAQKN